MRVCGTALRYRALCFRQAEADAAIRQRGAVAFSVVKAVSKFRKFSSQQSGSALISASDLANRGSALAKQAPLRCRTREWIRPVSEPRSSLLFCS